MVRLVVQEINAVCHHLQKAAQQCTCAPGQCGYPSCASEVCVYGSEQLEHFSLVLLVEGREKWLQDDFCPLTLQNPWTRGKLCVRFKEYSPLALQYSRATTVWSRKPVNTHKHTHTHWLTCIDYWCFATCLFRFWITSQGLKVHDQLSCFTRTDLLTCTGLYSR